MNYGDRDIRFNRMLYRLIHIRKKFPTWFTFRKMKNFWLVIIKRSINAGDKIWIWLVRSGWGWRRHSHKTTWADMWSQITMLTGCGNENRWVMGIGIGEISVNNHALSSPWWNQFVDILIPLGHDSGYAYSKVVSSRVIQRLNPDWKSHEADSSILQKEYYVSKRVWNWEPFH